MANLTPLMKQYWEIKSLHQDKILLFRMGDFYEMFFDDAVKAAPLLGIALTQRNKKSQDETPMCGMPHHSVAGPINKLLSHGLKVAICDQIEDPKQAKGLVKRAVTRVLTPGMVYDPETLDQNQSHYIAGFDSESVSFVDTTTGESFFIRTVDIEQSFDLLQVLPVAEVVCSESDREKLSATYKGLISPYSMLAEASDPLLASSSPESARRLVAYIRTLSTTDTLNLVKKFTEKKLLSRMHLGATVLRHLEVFANYRGEDKGSLFESLCRTKTPAGTRRLREYLQFPLTEASAIQERFESVEFWRLRIPELKNLRETLAKMGDLERRLSKLSLIQANARDLLSLAQGLDVALKALSMDRVQELKPQEKGSLEAIVQEIFSTLVEEPPLSVKQGEIIRKGVSKLLDEYIELTTESHKLLQEMEAQEKAATQIPSLKIRYNNVFGYYIEVTNTHKDKVPARYQRKQTLSTAERYVTEELLELEKKVITAQSKRYELEFEIFEDLRKRCLKMASLILRTAQRCSYLDVESSFAWLSLEQKYVRPSFSEDGSLQILGARHPVVEQSLKGRFVPNDIGINSGGCLLLTGPNMAGKSTLMRQVALISLMAQMGSYVPAEKAQLPLIDQVYTRIGASDSLTEGLSTFMVEMIETSEMLKKATPRSLLILDEVGRGTSTYDGMALAQAILEHILKKVACLTLFATHYHELTSLELNFPQVQNAHMSVIERQGKIEFLHTLQKGPALKSYGIHVAEIAGLPGAVIQRAQALLKKFESDEKKQLSLLDWTTETEGSAGGPEAISATGSHVDPRWLEFMDQIKSLEISQVTPLEALNKIAQWQKSCLDLS